MNSDPNWANAARQFQETLGASMQQAFAAMAGAGTAGLPPAAPSVLMQGMPQPQDALPALQIDPAKLLEIQNQYLQQATALWNGSLAGSQGKAPADKRFASEAWQNNPIANFSASAYLLNAKALTDLAEAVEADAKTKARVRFAVEQWLAAMSPSNYLALNAEAQKKAIETQGQSIAQGIQNLVHDLKQGHVSMTDESVFEVGKNVATTEGAVVFETSFSNCSNTNR